MEVVPRSRSRPEGGPSAERAREGGPERPGRLRGPVAAGIGDAEAQSAARLPLRVGVGGGRDFQSGLGWHPQSREIDRLRTGAQEGQRRPPRVVHQRQRLEEDVQRERQRVVEGDDGRGGRVPDGEHLFQRHAAREPFAAGDAQVEGVQSEGLLEEGGQLARRHAVAEGGGQETDERLAVGRQHGAVGRREHERVGAVGDDEGLAGRGARFHEQAEGGAVGVGAAGDGLEVEHDGVQRGQHLRGGRAGGAVEGVDGNVPVGMPGGVDGLAGAAAAVETVFGAEEGGEPDAAAVEVVGGVFAVGGPAGGMGDETGAGAAEPVGGDAFDAGADARRGNGWDDCRIHRDESPAKR